MSANHPNAFPAKLDLPSFSSVVDPKAEEGLEDEPEPLAPVEFVLVERDDDDDEGPWEEDEGDGP